MEFDASLIDGMLLLLMWSGVYNTYSHCPEMNNFITNIVHDE